jgi:GTP-binding protein EngB required for normal cell division
MDYSSLYFTKEIQDYLHSCENLLAVLSAANTASRISMEEREMLGYSVAELQKVLVVWDKAP